MIHQWLCSKKSIIIFSAFLSISCSNTTINSSIDQGANGVENATNEPLIIAENAKTVTPITIGQPLPTFSVLTASSESKRFSSDTISNTTVIVTYRGGWCPYCNVHLQELRKVLPSLNKMGIETVFLSGDRPEILLSSLQEQTQKELADLPYQLYSDANLEAASALGVAFAAKDTKMKLLQFIKDTKGSSLDKHSALAVPSVFIVDKSGIIQYVYFNPDYKKRLSADELLSEVNKIVDEK